MPVSDGCAQQPFAQLQSRASRAAACCTNCRAYERLSSLPPNTSLNVSRICSRARCCLVMVRSLSLGSYPLTRLAETPRPSCHHWLTRDCSDPHASRRVEDVSPIPLRRLLRVLRSAALPEPDRAALSTRSDGVSDR